MCDYGIIYTCKVSKYLCLCDLNFFFFFGKKSLHTPIKWRTPANAVLTVHWYVCADIYTLRHKYMNYE